MALTSSPSSSSSLLARCGCAGFQEIEGNGERVRELNDKTG